MGIFYKAGIFLGLAIATVSLCLLFPNAGNNSEPGLVMWLPEETSELRSEVVEVSKVELDTLPPDTTFLKKQYFEKYLPEQVARYRAMGVTLILQGSDRRSLHEPEVCLVGQGWDIERSVVTPIETSAGTIRVRNLHLGRWLKKQDGSLVLTKDGEKIKIKAHYIYWWVSSDDSTPNANERIIKTAIKNIFANTNDRWGYPSVMVPVDARLSPEEGRTEATNRGVEFIKEFAPKFQVSLGAEVN